MADLRGLDPLSIAAAVVCGVVLGVGLGWVFHGSASAPLAGNLTATTKTPGQPPPPPPPPPPSRRQAASRVLGGAMSKSVREGKQYGRLEAATMVDGAAAPVARPAGDYAQMRTWSMAKVITALTLLRRTKAGQDPGLDRYLESALRRSDNCAQRKLTLELQRASDAAGARAEIASTVQRAGAKIDVDGASVDTDGAPECAAPPYPEADRLGPQDASPATQTVQLGTTRWGVRDAARFAYALRSSAAGNGPYGQATAQRIRRLMRAPKLRSQEPGAEAQITADPAWGAGKVFTDPCWKVAYKAGWGGQRQGNFLAGQMGTVELAGGHWVAFAVMFHPSTQPANDDPGKVHAAEAIEQALTTLKAALNKRLGGCAR